MAKIWTIQFTKEGYEKIKKDYDELLAKRKPAVLVLKEARELGDLSENGLYKAARANLSSIDNRLRRLDNMIKRGEVVNPVKGVVGIGSKVIVSDGKMKKEFSIVGEQEADPLNHKISNVSPIGKALLGKKVGDSVVIEIPSGKLTYKILEIS